MASYNVLTSVAEESALSAVVAKRNAERAAQTPPLAPITNAQYVTALFNGIVQSYVRETEDETGNTIKGAWKNATPAQRNAARTALGM